MWLRHLELDDDDGDVLCCYGGTQLQDGLWSHLKKHTPTTVNTNTEEAEHNINLWAGYWAWRYRRVHCVDLFCELGGAVAAARASGRRC
jgi:hypothetical protein